MLVMASNPAVAGSRIAVDNMVRAPLFHVVSKGSLAKR
jgi:hypothetical protein